MSDLDVSVENRGLAGLRGPLLGNPHPFDTHPDLGGTWVLSSQAGIGRGQSRSEGWCCTGHSHGRAGSNTCLPGDTGGLGETEGARFLQAAWDSRCPLGTFWPSRPHPRILCLHLCVLVGRGRKRSPHGQCRWIPGHTWQPHSHPGSRHSPGLPSHSHTRSESHRLSSGRCHHFCIVGDPGLHTRLCL